MSAIEPTRKQTDKTCRASIAGNSTGLSAMAIAGGVLSIQEALDVATDIGLTTISHTQFAGDKWEIQGRDRTGRYIEVAVDATTGDVLWVNR